MVGAFTDDTALFYKADTTAELEKDIQQDILMLRMWFSDNYMIIRAPWNETCDIQPKRKHNFHNRFTIIYYP